MRPLACFSLRLLPDSLSASPRNNQVHKVGSSTLRDIFVRKARVHNLTISTLGCVHQRNPARLTALRVDDLLCDRQQQNDADGQPPPPSPLADPRPPLRLTRCLPRAGREARAPVVSTAACWALQSSFQLPWLCCLPHPPRRNDALRSLLGDQFVEIAFLREPLERALSGYYFIAMSARRTAAVNNVRSRMDRPPSVTECLPGAERTTLLRQSIRAHTAA